MNALNPSHAALVAEVTALRAQVAQSRRNCDAESQVSADLRAEVTALRASLGDAVELCESLRADRDKLRAACERTLDLLDQPSTRLEIAGTMRAALGRSAL